MTNRVKGVDIANISNMQSGKGFVIFRGENSPAEALGKSCQEC